jgi:rhomboid protease GluP
MIPDDQLDFLHAVWTRRPLFTYLFLGVNIVIFLLMALAGGSTNEPTMLAFGVKSNPEIAQGQWWRFITPVFIHLGILHLLFNSYALWIVGPQVEKLYGAERFVVLYLLTGTAGVGGSYFYHPYTISAGASGAIFGLFGVLLVFGLRYRSSIPPALARAVGTGVLPVIVINLIIGFTIPAIDNAAHIGGLLAGGALAAIIPYQKPGEETSSAFKSLQMVLLATVLVSFYMVARNYDGPRLAVSNLRYSFSLMPSGGSTTQQFINTINNTERTFRSSARELETERTGRLDTIKAEVAKSIDQLRRIPSLDSKTDELSAGLLRVMQDQYGLIEDVERAGTVTFAHSRRMKENVRAYEDLSSQLSEWVSKNGRRYGITETNR